MGSTENKKYCGTDIPSLITSVYNFLYVIFVKSSSTENRGFMAQFSTKDLGKWLTVSSGLFLRLISEYVNNVNKLLWKCTYTVYVYLSTL